MRVRPAIGYLNAMVGFVNKGFKSCAVDGD